MRPGAYVFYNNTIAYDWKNKSGQKWTVPLGLGVGRTFDTGGGHGFDLSVGFYRLGNWGRPDGSAKYMLQFGLGWIFPR